MGISLPVALEQELHPPSFHLFKMNALEVSTKAHYSCSRVARLHLPEIFVGFKETGFLASSEFPLQLLSDSSLSIHLCFYAQPHWEKI